MEIFNRMLIDMKNLYLEDPVKAVRSKGMIGKLENFLKDGIQLHLTDLGKKELSIKNEMVIFQAEKEKNVDVVLVHPTNGPIITIGVRSQMSSVAKNTLTYYQDIEGECVGLQSRYPMSVHSYVYMHPKEIIAEGKLAKEKINHIKYAHLFNSLGGRGKLNPLDYKNLIISKAAFDYFSYFIVDFKANPVSYKDDWTKDGIENLSTIKELVEGVIKTAKERFHFKDYFI
jgi:hypothetical protein